MIKKPTTTKLLDSQLVKAVDYNGNPYIKLFPDEEFYEFPDYPNVYISQYANVLRVFKNVIRQRKLEYDKETGYSRLTVEENYERKRFKVHRMVALVWCEKPNFEIPNLPEDSRDNNLEVHHLIKVRDNLNEQPINLNWAENLVWVPHKYHVMIDQIKSFQVQRKHSKNPKAKVRKQSIQEIAKYYNVSEYDIYELVYNEPDKVKGMTEIYKATLSTLDGNQQQIEITITKYGSKSKKSN